MSSSCLEAELSALASTIRARLQRDPSHRLKVSVYKWWDMVLIKFHSLTKTGLGLGHRVINNACSSRYRLSAIARVLGRESLIEGVVSGARGVDVVIARVGR